MSVLVARAVVAVSTGRGVKSADDAIERLKASAVAREQAEARAAAEARQKKIQDRANARAARGWF
jgi:hypothetical protein